MKIFEEATREIGNRPANQAESKYEYLRDSKRPITEIIRNFMEKWFELYQISIATDKKINDLASRFRSKDDFQFLGAFTELYTFVFLKNFGFEIIAEEETQNGKRPDFLVKTPNSDEFYVEVTTVSDGKFSNDREKAVKIVVDKIDQKIKSANYDIELKWSGKCCENDVNPKVLREIQSWIDSPNNSIFKREFCNWTLELSPILVSEKSNSTKIVSYIFNPKVQCFSNKDFQPDTGIENVGDFLSSIKETLTEKATHYGELGKPYIIIINILSNWVTESVVEDAVLSETLKNGTRISSPFFSKQTNVNGVLACFNLDPGNIMDGYTPRKELLYFINPNATEDFNHYDFKLLLDNELFRENVWKLNRTKLLLHLGLAQKEWNDALVQEDPGSKRKNSINWMQNCLKNFDLK